MEKLGNIKSLAIYGSRSQEGYIDDIISLISTLVREGCSVSVEKKLAGVLSDAGSRLHVHGVRTCSTVPPQTQLVISVGGDGTFLRSARWLAGKEIPILGINTGHLGFLAENSSCNIEEIVSLIRSGEASIERRLVLEVECADLPPSEWPFALNEVTFMKGAASMIDVHVGIEDMNLATYSADGLIIATPTGSTAYNLSVGGPILAPTLHNIVLSPIAPHSLTLRPVVVGGDADIEAMVESRAPEFRLIIDGHASSVPCGSKVRIRKARHCVLTIRRPGENFATTLRSKLLWGS